MGIPPNPKWEWKGFSKAWKDRSEDIQPYQRKFLEELRQHDHMRDTFVYGKPAKHGSFIYGPPQVEDTRVFNRPLTDDEIEEISEKVPTKLSGTSAHMVWIDDTTETEKEKTTMHMHTNHYLCTILYDNPETEETEILIDTESVLASDTIAAERASLITNAKKISKVNPDHIRVLVR